MSTHTFFVILIVFMVAIEVGREIAHRRLCARLKNLVNEVQSIKETMGRIIKAVAPQDDAKGGC